MPNEHTERRLFLNKLLVAGKYPSWYIPGAQCATGRLPRERVEARYIYREVKIETRITAYAPIKYALIVEHFTQNS
jgi:hypothetical protein